MLLSSQLAHIGPDVRQESAAFQANSVDFGLVILANMYILLYKH